VKKEAGSFAAALQAVARKLYRSLGFETFGVEDRALKVGETYLKEEYMVLRFGAPLKRA